MYIGYCWIGCSMTSPFLRFHPMGFPKRQETRISSELDGRTPQGHIRVAAHAWSRFPSKKFRCRCMRFVSYFWGGEFWKEVLFLVWFDMNPSNQVAWTPQTLGKHLLKSDMEVANVPSRIIERSYSSVPHYLGPHHFGVFVFNFHRVTVNENLSLMLTAPFCSCGFGLWHLNTEPNKVFGALLGCPWKLATS